MGAGQFEFLGHLRVDKALLKSGRRLSSLPGLLIKSSLFTVVVSIEAASAGSAWAASGFAPDGWALGASLLSLLGSAVTNPVSLLALLVICGLAGRGFWRYLMPLRRKRNRLIRLNQQLAQLPRNGEQPPYNELRNIAVELDQWQANQPGAGKREGRLASQLEKFQRDARDHYMRDLEASTACPGDYLATDDILPADFSWTVVRSMPAVLTTLGILFTFVGLALGVSELAENFQAAGVHGNPDLLTKGVLGLMAGLGISFSSSIVGILLAVLWGYTERRRTRAVQSEGEKLLEQLDELFPSIDDAQVWRFMLEINSDQRDTLKTLAQDVAAKIIEGFNSSLETHLAPALGEMKTVLERVADTSGDEMRKAMESMIDKFGNVLGERLKQQFDNLANTIENLCVWQEKTKENLDAILVKLGETLEKQEEMIRNSSRAAELFQESLGRLGELHGQLSATLESFESLSEGMQVMGDKLDLSRESMEGGLGTMREVVDKTLGELSEAISEYRATMESGTEKFGDLLSETVEGVRSSMQVATEELRKSVGGAVNDLRSFSTEHREAVASELTEISAMATVAKEGSREIEEALTESMKEFREELTLGFQHTWQEFDKQLAKLATSLSGTASGSEETIRELNASVGQVRAQATEMMESVSEVETRIGSMVEGFAGQVGGAVDKAMDNVVKSVERLDRFMIAYEQQQKAGGAAVAGARGEAR